MRPGRMGDFSVKKKPITKPAPWDAVKVLNILVDKYEKCEVYKNLADLDFPQFAVFHRIFDTLMRKVM